MDYLLDCRHLYQFSEQIEVGDRVEFFTGHGDRLRHVIADSNGDSDVLKMMIISTDPSLFRIGYLDAHRALLRERGVSVLL
jgi:hypothetical protein